MNNQNRSRIVCFRRSVYAMLALATLSLCLLHADNAIQLPESFRRWVHVGTGVIVPGTMPQKTSEEGMHHIFSNAKAVEGYASGNFADGSMVAYQLRETKQQNGDISEGDRKRVAVMTKDSVHYASTGGWRFQRFMGNDEAQNAIHDS